ncbi:MAG: hypothetical protein KA714_27215 [Limnoraphis sp. WC205]|nr:hypothetical protein [Limnoraphis sp. WC205]
MANCLSLYLRTAGLACPYSDCFWWDAVEWSEEYAIANSLRVWGDKNVVKP